ncbi:hypothetical protein GGTG_01833 [Gaeumannomyces tritici R3-111a-1]|uniref:Uncharacterized protein n=1 Tax=Gaeumannomyces tritici (strain R3-111a-1) TaxID=644352 RepID=J3NKP2_GAET3|nr:hypothetical protein GGTG_01833 [Gaeumannomyces tritici R3-111a-1]EJT81859.1 hypothetical protein GGTG_01833 [Gaeumannomyces tritici R3-111a-1]
MALPQNPLRLLFNLFVISVLLAAATARPSADGGPRIVSRRQLVIDPPTMACGPCTQEGVKWCTRCSMAHEMRCADEFSVPCEPATDHGTPRPEDRGWTSQT